MATTTTTWLIAAGCVAVWVLAAIQPLDPPAWALEQVATLLALGVLWWTAPRVRYSRSAIVNIAVLFCVHTIGTHYTYSLTPYDAWSEAVTGVTVNEIFGWQRNHYDRFVHFVYGLCMVLPLRQAFGALLRVRPAVSSALALTAVMATSAAYELMEWGAVAVFGGGLGVAYLGTQGDPWDAQADMALAALGWGIGAALRLLVEYSRRFAPRTD